MARARKTTDREVRPGSTCGRYASRLRRMTCVLLTRNFRLALASRSSSWCPSRTEMGIRAPNGVRVFQLYHSIATARLLRQGGSSSLLSLDVQILVGRGVEVVADA